MHFWLSFTSYATKYANLVYFNLLALFLVACIHIVFNFIRQFCCLFSPSIGENSLKKYFLNILERFLRKLFLGVVDVCSSVSIL